MTLNHPALPHIKTGDKRCLFGELFLFSVTMKNRLASHRNGLQERTLNLSLCQAWNRPRSFDFLNGLTFRLDETASTEERGIEFAQSLKAALNDNPDLFKNYSNEKIADVLSLLNKTTPDDATLIALYAAYDPDRDHEFSAWELGKRIEFLKALDTDPTIKSITDDWTSPDHCPSIADKEYLAAYQHNLQAQIYGFEAGHTQAYDKAPTGEPGKQNIWSASYSREDHTLFFNTHAPLPGETIKCTFQMDSHDFQSTIAHDTDHVSQDDIASRFMKMREEEIAMSHLGADELKRHMERWVEENLYGGMKNEINQMLMYSEEMRSFARIMHYSVYGDYYLSQRYASGDPRPGITFDIYKTNPSENRTFKFQCDVECFLGADAAGRARILHDLEDRRQQHLACIPAEQRQLPHPALAYAAE